MYSLIVAAKQVVTKTFDKAFSLCFYHIPQKSIQFLPEGALKSSDSGRRSGDVKNARLHHPSFAVRRPAIQDPVILTECFHRMCMFRVCLLGLCLNI